MADYNIYELNPKNKTLIVGMGGRIPRIYKTMEQAKRFADPGSVHIVHLEWEKVDG